MSNHGVFDIAHERYLNAYYGILVAGSIGHLFLFIATIYSKRIKRNLLLLQFYALFSIILWFDAILFWTGHKSSHTEDIPTSIRVINATVRGVGMIMNSSSSLIVTIRIWSTVNTAKATSTFYLKEYIDSPILILVPWLFGIPFFIAHLITSLKNTDLVVRTPYFCVVLNAQLNLATVLTATLIMFFLMIMALWTGVLLFKLRLSQIGLLKFRLSIDIQLISRIFLFLYYSVTSLVILLKSTIKFRGFENGSTLAFAATGLSYSHNTQITTNQTPSSDPLIPPTQSQLSQKERRLSLTVFLPPKARLKSNDKNTRQSESITNSYATSKSASTQSFPLLPL
ncbi:hypothetical protein E3P81_03095 [Wallemia ichthyophaga]|nr:hypothetical protein E3P97_03048 [Wallemia ichthyophaga]TIB05712.1 hypothetical protein E3P96_00995 [Wallemia ichthyophaga]TIB30408.1 hypothetical protein E3P85_02756 [Wallemia ichthyophaga]TIB45251.1 hypothetical protein E3P82_02974 [Wallemia ichthyophaga]TIB47905.1 hypothetical protein E3P81_03095 [Wallemia ichthyophaga]